MRFMRDAGGLCLWVGMGHAVPLAAYGRHAWVIGLVLPCGAVEGSLHKIFSPSITRDDQPLRGLSNDGSAFVAEP